MLVFAYIVGINNISVTAQTVIETIELEPPSGSGSIAVCVNPSTNRIYIANSCSNNVSVIDGISNTVIATIDVGDSQMDENSKGLCVNPDTNMIYVANSANGNINVIDGSTDEIVDTISVPNSNKIAVNPITNLVYVTSFRNNTISVIDGSVNEVIGTVNVGRASGRIKINTVTNRIYVSNSRNISVIDGSTNQVIDTIEIENPRGIGVNPVTNLIYVTSSIEDEDDFTDATDIIIVIDGLKNEIITTIDTGTSGNHFFGENLGNVIVNPTTNHIYVIEESFTDFFTSPEEPDACPVLLPGEKLEVDVKVIDGLTNRLIPTDNLGLEMGLEVVGIGVNPETNLIYVTSGITGTISVIMDEESDDTTPVLTSLSVNPTSSGSSLRRNEVIVTALDQNGQPIPNITVNASASGLRATVHSSSAITDIDGTVRFKFRFGFVTKDGKITFNANGLTANIVQENN